MWATGFLIEAVADGQKLRFRNDPKNKGKFIDVGLWSRARFPNYFGEMLLWAGVWVFTGCSAVGAIGPLWVVFQLSKMSGIPIQEVQAQERWGKDPAYQEYVRRTNLLVPLPKFGGEGESPAAAGGRKKGPGKETKKRK